MRAATCFSGIGAPEVAMPDWDWLWHADIEGFPNAVMAARHPESKNLGDVTADDFLQNASAFGKIDVLAGGPPCQDFSVAGLRAGVAGDRGNLTFRFLEITHAIRPRNLLVENVPGWLNMPDNAFGSFLGGLVGADDALLPCAKPPVGKSNQFWNWRNAGVGWQLVEPNEDGIKEIISDPKEYKSEEIERVELDARHIPTWPSAGMVAGPRARAAWRVFDAQYFGLAQRRKRVFVVADFGNGADPAKVLFERKSVRGNPPTREKAGKDVAGTIAARTRGGGGLGTDFDLDGGIVPEGCEGETAPTLNAAFGSKLGLDNQHIDSGAGLFVTAQTFDRQSISTYGASEVSSTVRERDFKDVTDLVVTDTLEATAGRSRGAGTPTSLLHSEVRTIYASDGQASTAFAEQAMSFKPSHYTRGKDGAPSDISPPLSADADKGDQDAVVLVPEIAQTLLGKHNSSAAADMETYVAGGPRAYRTTGNDGCYDLGDKTNALTTNTDQSSHVVTEAIGFAMRGRDGGNMPEVTGDIVSGLRAASGGSSRDHVAVGFAQNQRDELRLMDVAGALAADPGMKQQTYVKQAWSVRRLTPTECARLQGFGDDYCNIEYRGKPAADGPIYKALGNSWAVKNGRWILERIERFMP